MKRIILATITIAAVAVSALIWKTWLSAVTELKATSQTRVELRSLTEENQYKLFLYEQVIGEGLTYADYRILHDIVKAESRWRQFDETGVVLKGVINQKDTGLFQINTSFWLAKANQLEYDIYEPEGNLKMGLWIYRNHGVKPWSWSQSMWKIRM